MPPIRHPHSLLVLLAALAPLAWQGAARGGEASADSPESGDWLRVEPADFTVVCREDGWLLPVKVTTIGFMTSGSLAWMVEEGTRVKKGETIARLDTAQLETTIEAIRDELAVAERDLAQQQQARELEVKRLDAELQAERDKAALAEMKEREAIEHPTELEREEAANLKAGAEARVAAARADWEAMRPLIEKGYANRSDLEAKELALKLAETELERAQMQARVILDGARSETRRRAALERLQAETALKLKDLDRRLALEKLEAKIQSLRHKLKRVVEKRDDHIERLERCTRTAPHDGIVVYREIGWRSKKKVALGERVNEWQPPFDLPSYDKMKVRTQVPESVVRQLKARREGQAGSKALVRIKTLPDVVYHGEVTWIDGWARDRNAKLSDADIKAQGLAGLRVFDLEVELEESDPTRLREGFKASVAFPIETLPNTLAVPRQAVRYAGRQAVVRVAGASGGSDRPVTLGPESNGQVVIREGLQAGDRVWVPPAPVERETPAAGPAKAAAGGGGAPAAGGGNGDAGAAPAGKTGGEGKRRGGGKRSGGGGPPAGP
ncbi:MAG: hypothetical protein HS116_20850 [Planctomycetes bacterium]|nr:hypothetical protein [Planctomycetota bacterium]